MERFFREEKNSPETIYKILYRWPLWPKQPFKSRRFSADLRRVADTRIIVQATFDSPTRRVDNRRRDEKACKEIQRVN